MNSVKSELRAAIKNYFLSAEGIAAMQKAESLQNSSEYCKRFLTSIPSYDKAKTVFAYYPLKPEFPTLGLLKQAVLDGKIIGLPLVSNKDLIFKKVNFIDGIVSPVRSGCFGILEPAEEAETLFPIISGKNKTENYKKLLPLIILVPGRAFEKNGSRLGRGGGFYDRFFYKLFRLIDRSAVTLAGVCFSGQVVNTGKTGSVPIKIPMEKFDFPVDLVLTE